MKLLFRLLFCLILLQSSFAQASGKEFFTSVIYGTLAGTLVGAATLAFTSNPGENLNAVARGASYGLYAGILLGIYVTYGVNEAPQDEATGEQGPGGENPGPPPTSPDGTAPPTENPPDGATIKSFYNGFAVYPLIPRDARESWGVGVNLLTVHF
jgi:hypothetical protein